MHFGLSRATPQHRTERTPSVDSEQLKLQGKEKRRRERILMKQAMLRNSLIALPLVAFAVSQILLGLIETQLLPYQIHKYHLKNTDSG